MDPPNSELQTLRDEVERLRAQVADKTRVTIRPKEPDLFHGNQDENVRRWLFQVEQYFAAVGLTDNHRKVTMAATLLRGKAQILWESVVTTMAGQGIGEDACPWSNFKTGLEQHFRPVNFEDKARSRLARLIQRTSVSDYSARSGMSKTQLLNLAK